jgi:SWI/SNF-related matrix-associated actin-dependent regulator of chromatin subfamily A member 5
MPNAPPEPYTLGEHLVLASGKFILLDKLLPKLFKEGHRVLLFSTLTSYFPIRGSSDKRMLDYCEDFLNFRGYTYARLDGSTTRPRRALDIRLFNQKNSRSSLDALLMIAYQCYLLSTKAGGLGVNLTGADTVIFLDSDFNPQV